MQKVSSYEQVMSERLARLVDDAESLGLVFEKVYSIAMQVVALREDRDLTQAELAERCGIHQSDISRIERGSISPTTRTLPRIAEALDDDVSLVARAP